MERKGEGREVRERELEKTKRKLEIFSVLDHSLNGYNSWGSVRPAPGI